MVIYKKCNKEGILLRIKPLTKEQIIISVDRLTRFKHPEAKYTRVFKDIIINNLISPKFKKSDLDKTDYKILKDYAEEIINYSLEVMGFEKFADYSVNKALMEYEKDIFKISDDILELLDNKINYQACLKLIDNDAPKNLQWLKTLVDGKDAKQFREEKSLRFPVEKVVIAEGITEETLLPEFAKLCKYDFDKKGVYILSAGGKNQVVKLFYQLSDTLKLPIFVLMDIDAQENYEEIKPKLRKSDKVHILKCGEFEDALPLKLIERTLKEELKNISITEPITKETKMVKVLEEIFKHRGMHEFKKAEFAQMVKKNLKSKEDVSDEIEELISEIKNYC